MPDGIRSTQRAPKSCTACYSRKVRCSREVPCRQCVHRGSPSECKREVVRVKGRIRTADTSQSSPTYADLLQENLRLRALLTGQDSGTDIEVAGRLLSLADKTEWYEIQLFAMVERSPEARCIWREEDILFPSRTCSDAILEIAPQWTSWIHFALCAPQFQHEHEEFWRLYSAKRSLDVVEPLWMAVYFSVLASTLLFMPDESVAASSPPSSDFELLLRNWYSASLFFLDKGDFTRKPHINTVQTITILGIIFHNMGDISRHKTLGSVALRMAQQLKLGNDSAHPHEDFSEQQVRRRLWWTLVICEWLPIPFRTPFINDVDFDCRLPENVDDDELNSPSSWRLSRSKPRPIQYHIIMSRLAMIYYRFRYKLRIRHWPAEEVTQIALAADDELANLIGDLPPFLQADEPTTDITIERDAQQPWIKWQRQNLAIVFLYYRIAINRVLQQHWLQGSPNKARVRAICLSSAQAIIRSIVAKELDASKFRQWKAYYYPVRSTKANCNKGYRNERLLSVCNAAFGGHDKPLFRT
jgi:hypothetical protein